MGRTVHVSLQLVLLCSFLLIGGSALAGDLLSEAFVSDLARSLQEREREFIYMGPLPCTFDWEGLLEEVEAGIARGFQRSGDYILYSITAYEYEVQALGRNLEIRVETEHGNTVEEDAHVHQEARAVLKDILDPQAGEQEKAWAIFNHVVTSLMYDETQSIWTAYDALERGQAVCQGFALWTHVLLQEAGLTSRIVGGEYYGQKHSWNLVQIDGAWFHMDTTHSATIYEYYSFLSYNLFLLSDAQKALFYSWPGEEYPQAETCYGKHVQDIEHAALEPWPELRFLEKEPLSSTEDLAEYLYQAMGGEEKPELLYTMVDGNLIGDLFPVLSEVTEKIEASMPGYIMFTLPFFRDENPETHLMVVQFFE